MKTSGKITYRKKSMNSSGTLYEAKVDLSSKIRDGYPDDLWTLFCDAFGITYYDKTAFLQHWDEFQKKLMNCTYSQLCDEITKSKEAAYQSVSRFFVETLNYF